MLRLSLCAFLSLSTVVSGGLTYRFCCRQPIVTGPFVWCLTGPGGGSNRSYSEPSCEVGFDDFGIPASWLLERLCSEFPDIPSEAEFATLSCEQWFADSGEVEVLCWSTPTYVPCRPGFDYDGDDDVDLLDFSVYQRSFEAG